MVGLFFLIKQNLNLSLDPKQAEDIAHQIVDYQIPGGDRGLVSLNVQGFEFAFIVSANNPEEIGLIVGRTPSQVQGDPEQFMKEFEKGLQQNNSQQFEQTSSRTESKQLCGQTVNVRILEGKMTVADRNQTVPALKYQTAVKHNGRLILIDLTTSGEKASSNAVEVFKSLKCK
jgi:hypothetical protein